MAVRRDLHEDNRLSWNQATRAHNAHKRDQPGFLAAGGSTLFPEEVELLGDIRGRRLVHLQCNAGQDTLSLVHLGPAEVVGVDISDEAVAFARGLARTSGLKARFERADVYDWLAAPSPSAAFDIVFSSYGALDWLSDLELWARGVAARLTSRGRLCLVEFHPILRTYDVAGIRRYPYFGHGRVFTEADGVGDYVGQSGDALWPWGFEAAPAAFFANPHRCHGFQWTIGDILGAVLQAGLVIDQFREYPYSNGCRFFDGMEELPGRRWGAPRSEPSLPMMFALAAHRP